MTRTWDENRATINGLWPMIDLTDDEIDLWHADLSRLDQDVLFEAIREVKRSKESLYPQLVWVHAAYRTLIAAKRTAERFEVVPAPALKGDVLNVDPEESRRIAAEITRDIESADAGDVDAILAKIDANIDSMDAVVACRLAWRAGALRRRRESCETTNNSHLSCVKPDHTFEANRNEVLRILRSVGS